MATRKNTSLATLLVGSILLIVATLTLRMLLGARHELDLATQAQAHRDPDATDRHLRHAIAYYLPGNPWVASAIERLRDRARGAERGGDPGTALTRWRGLRSAILALRSISTPYDNVLQEAAQHIARLSQTAPEAAASLRTPKGARALATRLLHPDAPNPTWTALGLTGFLLWVLAALFLIARGLTSTLRWVRHPAWIATVLIVVGFAAFVTGMALA
ncbi:MAG: hypothetical protein KAI47_23680 [Deltaproteobacteria bacterium]|nr:hypothetical protein [Deltaproteobacteria bacterium]